jgi:HlyD family secretion protein
MLFMEILPLLLYGSKNRMIKYIVILVILISGVAWWQGWIPLSQSPRVNDRDLPTDAAVRATIAPELTLSGEVKPAFQVDIKPEIGGKIRKIHVIPGQSVKKGDPLVTIDDTDILNDRAAVDAEIEGARLGLGKMRGNFERSRQLHERKLLSEEVFANILADYQMAENDLEKSLRRRQTVEDRLAKTRVISPFDGTILEIPVTEGQVVVGAASVNSGTNLMTFADLSSLLLISHINQLDANKISLGREMILKSPASGGGTASAEINFIAPLATIKNNIKGFEVRGVINRNDANLKPGVSVSVRIPLDKASNVVAVPITAVFEQEGSKVAYIMKDGKPERRKVKVGVIDSTLAEIQSGINEGDEVLLVVPPSAEPAKKKKS